MTDQTILALAGLILAFFVQTAAFAFILGRLFQRVSSLEKHDDVAAGVSRAVIRLEVEMTHVTQKLEALFGEVGGLRADLRALEIRHEADLLRMAGLVSRERVSREVAK